MRFLFLFLVSPLSLSFIFCSETPTIFGYHFRNRETEPWGETCSPCWTNCAGSENPAPLSKSQQRPDFLPLLSNAGVYLYPSPEPSSNCTLKAKLKCLFCLSLLFFNFRWLCTSCWPSPETCIQIQEMLPPAPPVSHGADRMICIWRCAFFFFLFSFSWTNAEEEAVPGPSLGESKIKLAS